jgi:hypothetical protein
MAVAAGRGVKTFIVTFLQTVTTTKPIWSDKYTPTEDLVLYKVVIRDADGGSLNKSTITLNIGKAVLGNAVDVNIYGSSPFYALELNEPAPSNVDITWTFTNNEGADKTIMMSFIFKRVKEAPI